MIEWPVEITENKYSNWYNTLIQNAKSRINVKGYFEEHHIIPRSFGGNDDSTNLVLLTAKEHYIAHALLWKIEFVEKKYHSKMSYALRLMIFGAGTKKQLRNYKCHSRIYESVRIEFSKDHSQNMTGQNNPFYGKKHSPETLEKIKLTKQLTGNWGGNQRKNYTTSEETRAKISKANKGRTWDKMFSPEELVIRKQKRSIETSQRNTGRVVSEEQRRKVSETRKKLFAEGRLDHPRGAKGIVPWNKGQTGLVKQSPETVAKRLATMKANGSFKGSTDPLIYRGVYYSNFGEAGRATKKTKSKIKTEIKYWGSNPPDDIKEQLDCGKLRFIPPNKGVQMGQEQRNYLSKVKKGKSTGANNGNAKTFIITKPNGDTSTVTGGFKKYCNENNISYFSILQAMNNNVSHYKGYTVVKQKKDS